LENIKECLAAAAHLVIVINLGGVWHEFKNRSKKPVFMINIHPIPEMVTEWAL
jgi:hypothetical protein